MQQPPHGQDSPSPPASGATHCRSSTAHCPHAVRQCIARIPLPTTPRHCGGALQEVQRPLPLSSVAVHDTSSNAHCPQAVWQCIARVSLFRQRLPPGRTPRPPG